jgi:hypothetical protein
VIVVQINAVDRFLAKIAIGLDLTPIIKNVMELAGETRKAHLWIWIAKQMGLLKSIL